MGGTGAAKPQVDRFAPGTRVKWREYGGGGGWGGHDREGVVERQTAGGTIFVKTYKPEPTRFTPNKEGVFAYGLHAMTADELEREAIDKARGKLRHVHRWGGSQRSRTESVKIETALVVNEHGEFDDAVLVRELASAKELLRRERALNRKT